MRRYDDVLFPRKIEEFKITETFAPPPIMVRLVSNSREAHNQLRSLRNIYTGGAALLPELRTKFLGLFEASNRPTITQVWGMTECGWVTTFKYPEIDDTCSIGRLLPGCHIKVVDADYEQHGAQKAGEIYTHSPYGMSCYWRNEQATEMAFEDKERYWLRTGDIGFVVSGKFYIADRAKEIFKVNGFQVRPNHYQRDSANANTSRFGDAQVAPPELEDALIALPGIRDAAVIGSGSNHGHSEHPIAFLVRDNPFVTAGDVLKGLSSRITRYKTNTCEVRFVDQLPKSETGKVLKGLLREYIN
jgi:acyl-coenzyme A synthetase/AMP-(fatty) acid ligase